MNRAADLIAALRHEVTEDGLILLDKLVDELNLRFWPAAVFDTALEAFGPQIHNVRSRYRTSLDRAIQHNLRVWNQKYGPALNPKQESYASDLLVSAIKSGYGRWLDLGKPKDPPLIACVLSRLSYLTNHERVHEGFKSRSGLVSRRSEIAGMLRGDGSEEDQEEARLLG